MLFLLFLYGFLASCAGLLAQVLVLLLIGERVPNMQLSPFFLFGAALIEEGVKVVFLWQSQKRFGQIALSWLPLFLFGLGFSFIETLFALTLDPNTPHTLAPILSNSFLHLSTVLIFGIALRHLSPTRPSFLALLTAVVVLHTLYNLFRLSF